MQVFFRAFNFVLDVLQTIAGFWFFFTYKVKVI